MISAYVIIALLLATSICTPISSTFLLISLLPAPHGSMSWKRSGQLISGPPTLSDRPTEPDASAGTWGPRLVDRLKQNTGGLSAFQRERQLVARYGDYGVEAGGSGSGKGKERGKTEWDVLKENHR